MAISVRWKSVNKQLKVREIKKYSSNRIKMKVFPISAGDQSMREINWRVVFNACLIK
jgi:hypothetical protein